MPEQSETSAPALAFKPRVYCKGCGYALVGLTSNTCPECGRGFELSNQWTFARRPPRGWVWRWGRWVLGVVLLMVLAAGAGLLWLWWGWQGEQGTIARLRANRQSFTVAPIGSNRLPSVMGIDLRHLTERVDRVDLMFLNEDAIESLDLSALSRIRALWVMDCKLNNSALSHLGGLKNLQVLILIDLNVKKPDLAFLEKLPALSELTLSGRWAGEAAFEHVERLKYLTFLSLHGAGAKDADLQRLRGFDSLKELRLVDNPISDAGLVHLHGLKSLRILWLDEKLLNTVGLAQLRQAIPGLIVRDKSGATH